MTTPSTKIAESMLDARIANGGELPRTEPPEDHDRRWFLLGVEFGVRCAENGKNLQAALAHANEVYTPAIALAGETT